MQFDQNKNSHTDLHIKQMTEFIHERMYLEQRKYSKGYGRLWEEDGGGGGNVSFVDREQSMLIKKNAMNSNHVNKTNSEPRN